MTTCHNDTDLAHTLQLTRREIEALPVWCTHRIGGVTFLDYDKPEQEYLITFSCREMEDLLDWFSHKKIEALNAVHSAEFAAPEYETAWRTYHLYRHLQVYVSNHRWTPHTIPDSDN